MIMPGPGGDSIRATGGQVDGECALLVLHVFSGCMVMELQTKICRLHQPSLLCRQMTFAATTVHYMLAI